MNFGNIMARFLRKSAALIAAVSVLAASAERTELRAFAEAGTDNYYFALNNIKADEGEYNAFIRLGKEFYESRIAGIYPEHNGAITQHSVYAFEYALNKNILSDSTIERLVESGIIDLPTYAQTVNSFCAEMMREIAVQREENGVTAPDFDELTLNGYDLFNSRSSAEYLGRYAVLEQNALWHGSFLEDDEGFHWECVNDDGQLVFGWVECPGGDIYLQTFASFSTVTVNDGWPDIYQMIISNDRYYFLKDGVLQQGSVVINFKDYEDRIDKPWWEEGYVAEDRDITVPLDENNGISADDFEKLIGETNKKFFYGVETLRAVYVGCVYDYSLPAERKTEYDEKIELQYSGAEEVSVDALSTVKLNVSVKDDPTGWYGGQTIYFSSSNPTVADVDYLGNVYGISEGDAVITAVMKTSGICRPVQVRVHVNGSPVTGRSLGIGYTLEDSLYRICGVSVNFDALTDKLVADGATSVIPVDQPMFFLDGDPYFSLDDVADGTLTLEHRGADKDDAMSDWTIPMGDYKALADMAHKKGIKIYPYIQAVYNGSAISSDSSFSVYLERYATDPTDEKAKAVVDKYFAALEGYWTDFAAKLEEAGIDGIYLHCYNIDELRINDGHWSSLIKKVRQVFSGEILSMDNIIWDYQVDLLYNNHDLFDNVDRIGIKPYSMCDDIFSTENPSLEECKNLIENYYMTDIIDKVHELYQKKIDIESWVSSTAIPTNLLGDVGAGKGLIYTRYDSDTITHVDYLQQMIVWQAMCEVYSARDYVGTMISSYRTLRVRGYYGTDYRSGYDCDATVYEKPASKLLERWSVKAPLDDAIRQADAALSLAGDKYAADEVTALKSAITLGYAAEGAENIAAAAKVISDRAAEVTEKVKRGSKPAVTAAAGDGAVTLSWDAVDGADSYRIFLYYKNKFRVLGDTVDTSFTAEDLTNDTKYGFLVLSCINGEYSSYDSDDIVYATPKSAVDPHKPVVNAEPTYGGADVTWNAVDGAVNYRVFTCVPGQKIRQFGSDTTGTSMTVKGLKGGEKTGIIVLAQFANKKWSTYTEEDIAYVVPLDAVKPYLCVNPKGNGNYYLIWSSVLTSVRYKVMAREKDSDKWELIGATRQRCRITVQLDPGKEYDFLVRGLNARGKMTPMDLDDIVSG